MPSIVALIPARAGSKRIPGKNTRDFFGHPLLAYTIHAARESGIFSTIVVSSEDAATGFLAMHYGAQWHMRHHEYAQDDSPDICWVRYVLRDMNEEAFAILRPTSPFRTAETIQRAWKEFQEKQPCDSIRAVEPVRQHPGKMWTVWTNPYEPHYQFLQPLLEESLNGVPWHSCPTQCLPRTYAQNASLEIAWTRCVTEQDSISGAHIAPFFTRDYEGFDLNEPDDWARATSLVDRGLVALPALAPQTPVPAQK